MNTYIKRNKKYQICVPNERMPKSACFICILYIAPIDKYDNIWITVISDDGQIHRYEKTDLIGLIRDTADDMKKGSQE